MKTLIPNFIKASIISSLLLIALGILLIVRSEATIMTISYVIGGVLIAIGVLAEIGFLKENKNNITKTDMDVIYGIVCIILGIVVINNPEAIASIIPLVIGIIIIVNSAVKLQYSLELKKEKNDLWLSTLILSIVMLVCGVVLIFNPFAGAVLLTKIVGVFILVYAVLDLLSTFFIRNTLKKFQEAVKEEVTEAKVIEEENNKELDEPKEK
ncbi:MAG: DUF308 domain-containing protein [Bacilli bacterium]|nr:DUF308 domain-containing protein [Bacilli bacterium]